MCTHPGDPAGATGLSCQRPAPLIKSGPRPASPAPRGTSGPCHARPRSATPDRPSHRFDAMPGLRHYVLVRHRHNWILLARFVLVGLSGVLVNLLVLNLLRLVGPPYEDVWIDLPATEFNVRWYHLFTTGAFLAANMWNF